MGYVLLAISLLAGVTKAYCGKRTSGYTKEFKDAALANMLRMIFCVLIGFVLTAFQSGIASFKVNGTVLAIAALSGIASSIFVVSWLLSVKKGAYMMVEVFVMLGMIVPLAGSYIFFAETIKPAQFAGLAVLFAAVLIMCSYNSGVKGKITKSALALLLVSGLSSGFADFSQKLFVEYTDSAPVAVFNFYTYIFSAIVLGCSFVFLSVKGNAKDRTVNIKSIIGYIIIMAVCLFANSYFQTQAAVYLPAAQLYPLAKGISLILSMLMSAIFFKERISAKCILGIILAFSGLLIINL